MHSLIIGRFQPFHSGHKKLIQTVLDEGKNVCIAIRDTEISKSNPYTVEERTKAIREEFPQAKFYLIPDIEEFVYVRGVGYGLRKIRLDPDTAAINGTEIRQSI